MSNIVCNIAIEFNSSLTSGGIPEQASKQMGLIFERNSNNVNMEVIKTSEKVVIWLYRNDISQSKIAAEIGITRQAFSQKIKTNVFTNTDIAIMKLFGYKG